MPEIVRCGICNMLGYLSGTDVTPMTTQLSTDPTVMTSEYIVFYRSDVSGSCFEKQNCNQQISQLYSLPCLINTLSFFPSSLLASALGYTTHPTKTDTTIIQGNCNTFCCLLLVVSSWARVTCINDAVYFLSNTVVEKFCNLSALPITCKSTSLSFLSGYNSSPLEP